MIELSEEEVKIEKPGSKRRKIESELEQKDVKSQDSFEKQMKKFYEKDTLLPP